MGKLILNCDLGENERFAQTDRLMGLVGAASICCGVHAGSESKTRRTLELAKHYGVLVGAHPGLAVAGGRGVDLPSAAEFDELLQQQLGRFFAIAAELGVAVDYVKLHGTLYSAVETDSALAEVYLNWIQSVDAEIAVFCLAGGRFARMARGEGITVWEELFADRGYTAAGGLVPRSHVGAMIEDVSVAVERLRVWLQTGAIRTSVGTEIELKANTLCVHGDLSNSVELIEALREWIV